jgi:hypothetical protein
MKPSCYFQIPRGNTSRYVFVFYLYGNQYLVFKKQLLGNSPYQTVVKYKVPIKNLMTFINTVVANVY